MSRSNFDKPCYVKEVELSRPPRNCDVGTAEEQAKKWYGDIIKDIIAIHARSVRENGPRRIRPRYASRNGCRCRSRKEMRNED